MKITGLEDTLEALRNLPPEIVSKRGGPVRSALRKGAVVIHKAELENLSRVVAGGDHESTGLLSKNVVITRGKAPVSGNGERMLVRVRRKTYVGKTSGKPVTTLATANLLEYGSAHQPAEPWIRPAFTAKAGEAIKTIEVELSKGISRILRKLGWKSSPGGRASL